MPRKQEVSSSSVSRVEHLKRVATWASSLSGELGAYLGARLASLSPPSSSFLSCHRCKSILQPGHNCHVRIRKVSNPRKAKAVPGLVNSVVYTCSFCSFQNVKPGTLGSYMKTKFTQIAACEKLAKIGNSVQYLPHMAPTPADGNVGKTPGSSNRKRKRKGWSSLKDLAASSSDLSSPGLKNIEPLSSSKIARKGEYLKGRANLRGFSISEEKKVFVGIGAMDQVLAFGKASQSLSEDCKEGSLIKISCSTDEYHKCHDDSPVLIPTQNEVWDSSDEVVLNGKFTHLPETIVLNDNEDMEVIMNATLQEEPSLFSISRDSSEMAASTMLSENGTETGATDRDEKYVLNKEKSNNLQILNGLLLDKRDVLQEVVLDPVLEEQHTGIEHKLVSRDFVDTTPTDAILEELGETVSVSCRREKLEFANLQEEDGGIIVPFGINSETEKLGDNAETLILKGADSRGEELIIKCEGVFTVVNNASLESEAAVGDHLQTEDKCDSARQCSLSIESNGTYKCEKLDQEEEAAMKMKYALVRQVPMPERFCRSLSKNGQEDIYGLGLKNTVEESPIITGGQICNTVAGLQSAGGLKHGHDGIANSLLLLSSEGNQHILKINQDLEAQIKNLSAELLALKETIKSLTSELSLLRGETNNAGPVGNTLRVKRKDYEADFGWEEMVGDAEVPYTTKKNQKLTKLRQEIAISFVGTADISCPILASKASANDFHAYCKDPISELQDVELEQRNLLHEFSERSEEKEEKASSIKEERTEHDKRYRHHWSKRKRGFVLAGKLKRTRRFPTILKVAGSAWLMFRMSQAVRRRRRRQK